MDVNDIREVSTGVTWTSVWPAILGTCLSVSVTILLFYIKRKSELKIREENQRKSDLDILNKQLDDILKIAVSYPYLETKKFCDTWDIRKAEDGDDTDRYQRYNVYCNLVFNYLSRLSEYCDFNFECIHKQHINMKEWVILHQKNWEQPLNDPNENIESYDQKFLDLIDKCLGKK